MIRAFSHLSDDRLIEACTTDAFDVRELQHLQHCRSCATRRADLTALLADVSLAATAEADAAFSPERLARQRTRILHRVEQDGRPARVITFPGQPTEPPPAMSRPGTRWVAGAAAAGLIIGLVAGHMSHDFPAPAARTASERPPARVAPLPAANAAFAEEELLGQIELAVAIPGGSALGTLNALTPRAWEVK
jgi:hypothetical protein